MSPAKRDPGMYLTDILSAIARIQEYTAEGKDAFFADHLVQDGVIRQFSIIGEAVAKLPTPLRAKCPAIPWRKIVAMRNIIIHDYSEMDLPTVWLTTERELPKLRDAVHWLLTENGDESEPRRIGA